MPSVNAARAAYAAEAVSQPRPASVVSPVPRSASDTPNAVSNALAKTAVSMAMSSRQAQIRGRYVERHDEIRNGIAGSSGKPERHADTADAARRERWIDGDGSRGDRFVEVLDPHLSDPLEDGHVDPRRLVAPNQLARGRIDAVGPNFALRN